MRVQRQAQKQGHESLSDGDQEVLTKSKQYTKHACLSRLGGCTSTYHRIFTSNVTDRKLTILVYLDDLLAANTDTPSSVVAFGHTRGLGDDQTQLRKAVS